MKITKQLVKLYEDTYVKHGMKVVLHNWQWQIASELMKELGAKKVTTTYKTKKVKNERSK